MYSYDAQSCYHTVAYLVMFYNCHLRPLQAANCCRNSRLVVDEDDLKWVKNIRKLPCIGKSIMDIFLLKPLNFRKAKSVSGM